MLDRILEAVKSKRGSKEIIGDVPAEVLNEELEAVGGRYVVIACWAAIIFDPVFGITDYLNIPAHWMPLFAARLSVAAITMAALFLRKRLKLSSAFVVSVPLILISLQNGYVYLFVDAEHVLGQNLNFIALLIGASLFVFWKWTYSVIIVFVATVSTGIFLYFNPILTLDSFFLNGGLLLAASACFMIMLVNARYNLNVRAIRARLALQESLVILQRQSEEIGSMNDTLERKVMERTMELEKKNRVLTEYSFITAHKLRGPLASILGLTEVFQTMDLNGETRETVQHLGDASKKLDAIVTEMLDTIEPPDEEIG